MSVLLPNIGISDCQRAQLLLEKYPQNIVGSFWLMCGYGFETEDIPSWWNYDKAQDIIAAFERGDISQSHNDPLYIGFCIIVCASSSNPADLSYVIEHLRMCEAEGVGLLRLMAKHKIPASTKVTYPEQYLSNRLEVNHVHDRLRESLEYWVTPVWEYYCSYLMGQHGRGMFAQYLERG